MFDDRMEISSPGGMANGRRIQDMDLRHIPSMRRNQVISDVFSHLRYMERRGSGIDRIMTSYAECAQKPVFYSDSTFFLVTLPNRSVTAPAQLSMESENVETSAQNMETTAQNMETSPQNVETSLASISPSFLCIHFWHLNLVCQSPNLREFSFFNIAGRLYFTDCPRRISTSTCRNSALGSTVET